MAGFRWPLQALLVLVLAAAAAVQAAPDIAAVRVPVAAPQAVPARPGRVFWCWLSNQAVHCAAACRLHSSASQAAVARAGA